MKCEHCGCDCQPTMTTEEYNERALPRLAAIDALAEKIDFGSFGWSDTPEGARYRLLMRDQGRDEVAAGL